MLNDSTDDSRGPFTYDSAGSRLTRPVEPAGMAPCYPAFTYDPGPRPEACDKPHVVIATPAQSR